MNKYKTTSHPSFTCKARTSLYRAGADLEQNCAAA